ncbi:hypothetical protein SpCBS45565_g01632 [Spizellomyces sp. 'palustris']|nr:hypothetical protein SpCBS45565_g01632 [Spizellomyces sp. 'palustris']
MEDVDVDRIYILESLRTKISQLRDSLNDFWAVPNNAQWPHVLSQFNVLVARYESLLGELRKSWLKLNLVIPSTVPHERPDQLPELLRTKLIPEIEELQNAQRRNAAHAPGLGSDEINYLDESAVRDAVRSWEARMEQHDILVQAALETVRDKDLRKQLKARIPQEEEDQDLSRFVDEAGKENKRDLERMLMWMSSGPQSWVEEESRRA